MGSGLGKSVRWRVYLYGLPAMAWGAFLLAAAVAPNLGPIEDIDIVPHQDKLLHFAEYLVQAMLTVLALVKGTRRPRPWIVQATFLSVAAYGVLLEAIQVLVPERDASYWDLAFNILGALVGTLAGMALLDLASVERTGQP